MKTLAIVTALLLGSASCAPQQARQPSDEALRAQVVAALRAASDVPGEQLQVSVSGGVVTLSGNVACPECGGRATPGGAGTVQQSIGAVVRAVPGVRAVRFETQVDAPP